MFVSDVHLGKVQHFRKHGLGVPSDVSSINYSRLEKLIRVCDVRQVIFLGDLFHSDLNVEWHEFNNFRNNHARLKMSLVKGNHDIIAEDLLSEVLDEILIEGFEFGPFALYHHPTSHTNLYGLCGHIHPSVKLSNRSRNTVRVPCFYFTPNYCVLPAFGVFTGTYTIKKEKDDEIFIIAEDEVLKL